MMINLLHTSCILLSVLYNLHMINADNCELPSDIFPNGSMTVFNKTRLRVHYLCDVGFMLLGESKQVCGDDGVWEPVVQPKCVHPSIIPPKCARLAYNPHSKIEFTGESFYHEIGDVATVICDPGFTSTGGRYKESFQIVCGSDGKWIMADGTKQLLTCSIRRCDVPPIIPNTLYHYGSSQPLIGEGSRVEYTCRTGYTLVDEKNNYLTCLSGSWEGPIPTCIHKSSSCRIPSAIPNGHWKPVIEDDNNGRVEFDDFPVGFKIEYYCDRGYKTVGSTMLECTDGHLWSKIPPLCILVTELNWYCPNLGGINNGVCKCVNEKSNNLMFCQPFERGVKIQCMCNKGYTLAGSAVLTCTHGADKQHGIWDVDVPFCLTASEVTVNRNGEQDTSSSDSYSTDGTGSGTNHVSTLVIVIATACSVLGVLLLVMVIVVFRRKKQRPHLFHPGMTPTPYSRVNISSIDDHDRVALMAYADATRVHLPTYEEAMQGQFRSSPSAVTTPTSTSTQGSEYRPLPHIPPTIRNVHGDSNRHSSVTTSTMNRDGTSEIFGSLDTVNVSMSDASTSGTVETFDSGTSTRSISSQRATAGSLMSSADNLANDDARLLDNRSEYMTELTTQTSIEEKED